MSLLEIKNLCTYFEAEAGQVKAVDGVSLSIDKGEVVAIVGGSGSGKTVLALSILRLVPEPGRIVSGEILFGGADLVKMPIKELRDVRGRKISMIFQEPMTCLNPVFTVGDQIVEALEVHEPAITQKMATSRAAELLNMVGIADGSKRLRSYPHELSGGQRQRVMIAMALACSPDILIADEPTTALDVTVQAQILDLLNKLHEDIGMTTILITHDFGIVAQNADRVYVMHEGRIAESGAVEDIFARPKDEYTKKLLAAVPVL